MRRTFRGDYDDAFKDLNVMRVRCSDRFKRNNRAAIPNPQGRRRNLRRQEGSLKGVLGPSQRPGPAWQKAQSVPLQLQEARWQSNLICIGVSGARSSKDVFTFGVVVCL